MLNLDYSYSGNEYCHIVVNEWSIRKRSLNKKFDPRICHQQLVISMGLEVCSFNIELVNSFMLALYLKTQKNSSICA